MISYRPRVYTASKLFHSSLWIDLYDDPAWSFIEWTARWPRLVDLERTATPADFGHFWAMDIQDVQRSDFVLLLGGIHEDALRGALVEAGAAIALGKIVVAVHLSPHHSWSFHPLVVRLDSLDEALKFFQRYAIPRIS